MTSMKSESSPIFLQYQWFKQNILKVHSTFQRLYLKDDAVLILFSLNLVCLFEHKILNIKIKTLIFQDYPKSLDN